MIKLDLRNLTPTILEQVKPNMGTCTYTSPCIIGALMSVNERQLIQRKPWGSIVKKVQDRQVSFPTSTQTEDAEYLQRAFDSGRWVTVLEIANKYMAVPVSAE
jgi:hypothetical protein